MYWQHTRTYLFARNRKNPHFSLTWAS
jgi:hypothetical protein